MHYSINSRCMWPFGWHIAYLLWENLVLSVSVEQQFAWNFSTSLLLEYVFYSIHVSAIRYSNAN